MEELFEGRWKIKNQHHHYLILINIYNNAELKISYSQLNAIRNGKNSISAIISRKCKPDNIVDNGVHNRYKKQKLKYAAKRLSK